MKKAIVLLPVITAFSVFVYAADSAKPAPSSPAVERETDAGQAGKPAAQAPKPPATELRFEPPPVPDFMLRKPEKPLTIEEMKRQADEAAEKARRARAAGDTGSSTPGSSAGSSGSASQ